MICYFKMPSIFVENGVIKWALDNCFVAMGFIHGPIVLSIISDIDKGNKTASECFIHGGVSKIAKVDSKVNDIKDKIIKKLLTNEKEGVLAIYSLVMSVVMEIYGLYRITEMMLIELY